MKFDYVARETLNSVRRNLLLTTASIVTVAVSLSMVGVAFLLRAGVNNATERWRNGIEFEIFMNKNATDAQKDRVGRAVEDHPNVKRVRFVGRDEQYRLFRLYFADQPEYLENVTAEDLPESYRVEPRIEDADAIRTLGQQFEKEAGVKQVEFAYEEVRRALRTSRALSFGMLLIAGVLLVASALLIANTVRMAIFSRRREIEVMKLVGATNWFIRVPFMIEGLLQGLVGAATAFAGVWVLRQPMSRWIGENIDQFQRFVVESGQVQQYGVVLVLLGALVGAVSAGVAVTRFLDV